MIFWVYWPSFSLKFFRDKDQPSSSKTKHTFRQNTLYNPHSRVHKSWRTRVDFDDNDDRIKFVIFCFWLEAKQVDAMVVGKNETKCMLAMFPFSFYLIGCDTLQLIQTIKKNFTQKPKEKRKIIWKAYANNWDLRVGWWWWWVLRWRKVSYMVRSNKWTVRHHWQKREHF